LVFAIGPEGGFTAREIRAAAQAGSNILDLGERILRVETAVSVAAILGSIQLAKN
jgi:16S rRNA (uracil1498-N3)-methyltransferase